MGAARLGKLCLEISSYISILYVAVLHTPMQTQICWRRAFPGSFNNRVENEVSGAFLGLLVLLKNQLQWSSLDSAFLALSSSRNARNVFLGKTTTFPTVESP